MAEPVFSKKEGALEVAMFENEKGNSIKLSKGYKKKGEEEWTNDKINLFYKEEAEFFAKTLTELAKKMKKRPVREEM